MALEEIRVRLDKRLKDALKARAKSQHRTMNGEVVALIEAAANGVEFCEKKEDK